MTLHQINKKFRTWMISRTDMTVKNIADIINDAEFVISDLDDTDASSPALRVVWQDFRSGRRMFDINFYEWCLKYGLSSNDHNRTRAWRDYARRFLSTFQDSERLTSMFNIDFVLSSLYKGVNDFYATRKTTSIYLTRNIPVIARAYAGVNHYLTPVCTSDKIKGVQKILDEHDFRSVLVKGDSETDEDVIRYLRSLGKQVFAIQVAKNRSRANSAFDLVIPRDYRGLNNLLED